MRPIRSVPVDQIEVPSFLPDERFRTLYTKFLKGEEAWLMRIELLQITRGFVDSGGVLHRKDVPQEDIDLLASKMRTGDRILLYVYRHPKAGIVCPDDQATLMAYTQLGIHQAPVLFLAPDVLPGQVAALRVRNHHTPSGDLIGLLVVQSASVTTVASIFGMTHVSVGDAVAKHTAILDTLLANLRQFQLKRDDPIHYHETLFAALVRAKSALRSINLLADNGCWLEARVVLRSLYELALGLYLDWLAPDFMGPLLHFTSVLTRQEYRSKRRRLYEDLMRKGMPKSASKLLEEDDLRGFDLANKVANRASANPLASLHKKIYSYLSRFAHQDYTLVVEMAQSMVDGIFMESNGMGHFVRFLDVVTTQLVNLVSGEIGTDVSAEVRNHTEESMNL